MVHLIRRETFSVEKWNGKHASMSKHLESRQAPVLAIYFSLILPPTPLFFSCIQLFALLFGGADSLLSSLLLPSFTIPIGPNMRRDVLRNQALKRKNWHICMFVCFSADTRADGGPLELHMCPHSCLASPVQQLLQELWPKLTGEVLGELQNPTSPVQASRAWQGARRRCETDKVGAEGLGWKVGNYGNAAQCFHGCMAAMSWGARRLVLPIGCLWPGPALWWRTANHVYHRQGREGFPPLCRHFVWWLRSPRHGPACSPLTLQRSQGPHSTDLPPLRGHSSPQQVSLSLSKLEDIPAVWKKRGSGHHLTLWPSPQIHLQHLPQVFLPQKQFQYDQSVSEDLVLGVG